MYLSPLKEEVCLWICAFQGKCLGEPFPGSSGKGGLSSSGGGRKLLPMAKMTQQTLRVPCPLALSRLVLISSCQSSGSCFFPIDAIKFYVIIQSFRGWDLRPPFQKYWPMAPKDVCTSLTVSCYGLSVPSLYPENRAIGALKSNQIKKTTPENSSFRFWMSLYGNKRHRMGIYAMILQ